MESEEITEWLEEYRELFEDDRQEEEEVEENLGLLEHK